MNTDVINYVHRRSYQVARAGRLTPERVFQGGGGRQADEEKRAANIKPNPGRLLSNTGLFEVSTARKDYTPGENRYYLGTVKIPPVRILHVK